MASGTWIEQFPGNMTWSNAALVTKGMAPYGAVALGEIDDVCERLKTRQSEPDAWQEEWCAMASRLEKVADKAASSGHEMTAGNYGFYKAIADHQSLIGQHAALRIIASGGTQDSGYHEGSPTRYVFISPSVTVRPSSKLEITAEVDYLKENQRGVSDVVARVVAREGLRAAVVDYSRPGLNEAERVRMYSFPVGEDLYRVTCMALTSRFPRYDADFEAIVSTLKSEEKLRQP